MLWLAFGLALLYFVTARPLPQSDPAAQSAFALSAALAGEKTPAIDHFVQSSPGFFLSKASDYPGMAYYQGHYYSDAPPGAGLLTLSFYQLGRYTGNLMVAFAPASNAPNEAPAALGLLAMSLAGAASMLLVYAMALRLGSTEISARYGALTFGLASALWREAGRFGPPALSLLLLTAGLFLALAPLPRQRQLEPLNLSFGRSTLLGLLLGLAITVDYVNLAWTPLFLIYLVWAGRLRPAGATGLVLGLVLGVLPLAFYNWLIFGLPWAFTYGYSLGDPQARSLVGQFLGGFSSDNLRQVFFGEGRAVLGPFLVFLGVWGLVALYPQRGKRKEVLLLIGLAVVSLLLGLLRRSPGQGVARIDFVVGLMPTLAIGTAVWHQRFQFLTRLERGWLPRLALWGVALYYLITAPGPGFPNLAGLVYLWPILSIGLVIGLLWWAGRGVKRERKGLVLTISLLLFTLLGLSLDNFNPTSYASAYFSSGNSNNLLYNSKLACQGQKLPGWYLSEACRPATPEGGIKLNPKATVQAYLTPVQGGKLYQLKVQAVAIENFEVRWSWSDEGHNPLPGEFSNSWPNGAFVADKRAAPPGASYLQLTFQNGPVATIVQQITLLDDSPRLEPMKNYATAALSFSFDWESAMGGLIHSKGGASFSQSEGEGETGGFALSENKAEREKAVANAEERGLAMRAGADNLLTFFQQFDIRGTFYATGYNLLDGNPERLAFAGNPIYKWGNPKYGWANEYWAAHPWYGDDPYGTYKTNPAWYFGDQTEVLRKAGQDIQSHTFGHLYVRGTTPAEFGLDLEAWVRFARAKEVTGRSFAFPWKSSNSVKGEHYKLLADNGFLSVTRLYDGDQGIRLDGEGLVGFDNNKRDPNGQRIYEPEAGPANFYYYLSRVKYEPRLLILNDYQLVPGDKSEAQARGLIDQLLQRRGYGSIWTHPEAVIDPRDKGQWQRVISYAASKRETGLWVDSVTNLVQHRLDIQQIGIETSYSDDNRRLRLSLTLTNRNQHAVDGLTLTLPGKINQLLLPDGLAYPDFKGAQLIAPKLEANQTLRLVVYLDK